MGPCLRHGFAQNTLTCVPVLLHRQGPFCTLKALLIRTFFNKIATDDFRKADKECPDIIREGLNEIVREGKSEEGRKFLHSKLNLCKPLKDESEANQLVDWIVAGYTYMAMVDYPYPTSFLTPHAGLAGERVLQESCCKQG